MKDHFYKVELSNIQRDQEDLLTSLVFEEGAQGLAEKLDFSQPDLTYDAAIHESLQFTAEAYFEEPPSEDFKLKLMNQFPNIQMRQSEEQNQDWLEEWKKGFEPFSFVEDFWVVPSWRQVPAVAKHPLFIDPGMAFGTGTHETTQLAGRLLFNFLKNHKVESCLDVGTGTGILALLAERMGVDQIEAMDIDPECRRVSLENLERNSSQKIRVRSDLVEDIQGAYPLVIANIIDGVLIRIKNDLSRLTLNEGHLVLAGILNENAQEVLSQFTATLPFELVERLEENGWVAFLLKKMAH